MYLKYQHARNKSTGITVSAQYKYSNKVEPAIIVLQYPRAQNTAIYLLAIPITAFGSHNGFRQSLLAERTHILRSEKVGMTRWGFGLFTLIIPVNEHQTNTLYLPSI